ncbi:MAG: hypothetical protein ACLTT1_01775 [[Clostridium] scindens]
MDGTGEENEAPKRAGIPIHQAAKKRCGLKKAAERTRAYHLYPDSEIADTANVTKPACRAGGGRQV